MATLLDSLTALATPAAGALSRRVIESDDAISRGLRASLASVLAGLLTRSDDTEAVREVFDLIAGSDNETNISANAEDLVRQLPASVTSGPGRSFLDTIFDGRTDAVGEFIARTAGFRKPASGASLLAVAASLVLGFFGRKLRDDALTVDGLTSMLAAEREDILAAAPPGLMDVVEGREIEVAEPSVFPLGTPPIGAAPDNTRVIRNVGAVPARRNRWVLPTIGLAAAVLIWFAFCSPGIS